MEEVSKRQQNILSTFFFLPEGVIFVLFVCFLEESILLEKYDWKEMLIVAIT